MEDATPLVSCVVATNRASPFLAEALRSVRAQSYERIEIVVVDDGSPEPAALDRILDEHPDVIRVRLAPSGVAAARNEGVRHASGELLAFLDDDDRWDRDRVALHVRAMVAARGAVASYGDLRSIDAEGAALGDPDQFDATARDIIARRVTVMLPNLMVRRSAFDAVGGFDETLTLAEDLDLVLALVRDGQVVYAPGALSDYRTHGSNVTRGHRALAAAVRAVVTARRQGDAGHAAEHAESLRANDRFAWWSAARSARAALRGGRPMRAVGEIGWAARFAPTAPLDALRRRLTPGV